MNGAGETATGGSVAGDPSNLGCCSTPCARGGRLTVKMGTVSVAVWLGAAQFAVFLAPVCDMPAPLRTLSHVLDADFQPGCPRVRLRLLAVRPFVDPALAGCDRGSQLVADQCQGDRPDCADPSSFPRFPSLPVPGHPAGTPRGLDSGGGRGCSP